MYYTAAYPSPVGVLTLVCGGGALVGLYLAEHKHHEGGAEPASGRDVPALTAAAKWLDRYFAGKNPAIAEVPLAPSGTGFREEVWRLLCEIPYGTTTTYGALAKKIAAKLGKSRRASQAIGGAVGHNPISIIIPCHRVIGADNSLTGYGGGIAAKKKLLALEGVDITKLYG
ncbi:MAG: methylated-DNA--[protein]-cysteine S-methyltransferase [Treponema sp.]|jgi:methylated-DNA-[protein]-cysteine S-methyltransferase|nr:methylated-DNA--[protein]-cysteine S-methyltransferase [Treponema sp.]